MDLAALYNKVNKEDPWRLQARCVGETKVFYEEDKTSLTIAKSVCKMCPVKEPCLTYALLHPEGENGVWGGKTPHELRKLRRLLKVLAGTHEQEPEVQVFSLDLEALKK